MNETNKRLEELLFSSGCQLFSEAERAELNALLRDNAEARIFAAQFLSIDVLLGETLATHEHITAFQPIPISTGRSINRPNWLARAAAWIGAFHLFSNTAKATTTTILMKKTVTSITAVILVLGGSGIYAIHSQNESSRDRVAKMETEIQSLSDQLGIQSTSSTQRKASTGNSRKQVHVTQVSAILSDSVISSHELAQYNEFKEQLAAMDAEALENMLLDAEKISSPIGPVAEMIMNALIAKDPAVASQIACQVIGRGSEFQFLLSSTAAKAFAAWLTKDPAAANAWYAETAAASGFIGNSIPPNGLEDTAIDRSFARLRFSSLAGTNPTEAAAMLATMLPADVTDALKTVTDPAVLQQIFPKLSPEQKVSAAEGAIKAMAASDLNAAFTWAKSLGMEDRDRDYLLAAGIEAAVENRKLDLPEVAERSRNLNLDAKKRSELMVSAATNVSLIPRKNEHVIDVENSVHWDRVAERIDWLRKEAPAGSADQMVGDYLGSLSYASHNLKKSLEAYENEVSRQGKVDPDLTIAFAFDLGRGQDQSAKAAALKLLNKLPPSEKRNHAIQGIEMNR